MTRNKKKGQARKPAPVLFLQDYPKARRDEVHPHVWQAACSLAEGDRHRVRLAPSGDVIVLNPRN